MKTLIISFFVSSLLLLFFMATKEKGYWNVINSLIAYRGNSHLVGESRGKEVFMVFFTIVYPIFYLLSVLIVYGFLLWRNKDNSLK